MVFGAVEHPLSAGSGCTLGTLRESIGLVSGHIATHDHCRARAGLKYDSLLRHTAINPLSFRSEFPLPPHSRLPHVEAPE